jgi:hypothetical protein
VPPSTWAATTRWAPARPPLGPASPFPAEGAGPGSLHPGQHPGFFPSPQPSPRGRGGFSGGAQGRRVRKHPPSETLSPRERVSVRAEKLQTLPSRCPFFPHPVPLPEGEGAWSRKPSPPGEGLGEGRGSTAVQLPLRRASWVPRWAAPCQREAVAPGRGMARVSSAALDKAGKTNLCLL